MRLVIYFRFFCWGSQNYFYMQSVFKYTQWKFPLWLSWYKPKIVSIRIPDQSLALLHGLRIWCCHVLWHRPAAVAPIQPLAWELPYAVGKALRNKQPPPPKKTTNVSILPFQPQDLCLCCAIYQEELTLLPPAASSNFFFSSFKSQFPLPQKKPSVTLRHSSILFKPPWAIPLQNLSMLHLYFCPWW